MSRVSPAIAVDVSLIGERVAIPERLRQTAGSLERIAVDNGPELISEALNAWAYRNGVQLGGGRRPDQRNLDPSSGKESVLRRKRGAS